MPTIAAALFLAAFAPTMVGAIEMSSSSMYEGCSEVFVGAGWAGVYSFYRRIMDDKSRANKACLFEQSWRVGGRTYSVKINNTEFIQDVGSYRFSPDMHLPGDLIMNDLQLSTECYQNGCPSAKDDFPSPFIFNYTAPLRRIVDPRTKLPGGYASAMHKMIDIAKGLGGRVFTQTALTKLEIADRNVISLLELEDVSSGERDQIKSPDIVILNLPRNRLFEVKGVEESLSRPVADMLKCIVFDSPPDLFSHPLQTTGDTTLTKAYLYYEDAWWHTVLNKTVGAWPPENHFFAMPTKEGVRFNIRWHDGPVVCSVEHTCDGLLETYYSISNETFYSSLSPSPEEPLGSIWYTDGPAAVEKLTQAHAGLMDTLTPILSQKGIEISSFPLPAGLVAGVWRRPTLNAPLGQGFTAPTKILYEPTMSGLPNEACGVPGLTDESYRNTALRPWGNDVPIFLVNNDWVCMNVRSFGGDWAEESLLMAERAMFLLGMTKPPWLDTSYYNDKVVSLVLHPSTSLNTTTESIDSVPSLILWLSAGLVLIVYTLYNHVQKTRASKDYTSIP